MRATVWSRSKMCEEDGTLKEWKGQDCLSLRLINDSSKTCQTVQDAHLQLGSEEWLIRHHLWINGSNIFCDSSIHSNGTTIWCGSGLWIWDKVLCALVLWFQIGKLLFEKFWDFQDRLLYWTSWGYPALPGYATHDLLFWFAPNVCFDQGCVIALKNWKLQPN